MESKILADIVIFDSQTNLA